MGGSWLGHLFHDADLGDLVSLEGVEGFLLPVELGEKRLVAGIPGIVVDALQIGGLCRSRFGAAENYRAGIQPGQSGHVLRRENGSMNVKLVDDGKAEPGAEEVIVLEGKVRLQGVGLRFRGDGLAVNVNGRTLCFQRPVPGHRDVGELRIASRHDGRGLDQDSLSCGSIRIEAEAHREVLAVFVRLHRNQGNAVSPFFRIAREAGEHITH